MSEPLTILYGPTPESRGAALRSGCGVVLLGVVLGAAFLGLGTVVALSAPGTRPLASGLLCCGAPLGLLLVAIGLRRAFLSGRDEQVVLDAERLSYRERALPIDRLVRIGARQDLYRGRIPRWTVTIQDDAGGAIELEVTQDRWVGTFDVRAILGALIPRLPPGCQVEPRVRAWVEGLPLA